MLSFMTLEVSRYVACMVSCSRLPYADCLYPLSLASLNMHRIIETLNSANPNLLLSSFTSHKYHTAERISLTNRDKATLLSSMVMQASMLLSGAVPTFTRSVRAFTWWGVDSSPEGAQEKERAEDTDSMI